MNQILNIKEACVFLGIKERTMYKLIHEGKIPAVKIGGQWRFYRQALLNLFQPGEKTDDWEQKQ
ncbi:MAG: helix-turn-helix domain-containing protein [Fidelibacterota bacterium]